MNKSIPLRQLSERRELRLPPAGDAIPQPPAPREPNLSHPHSHRLSQGSAFLGTLSPTAQQAFAATHELFYATASPNLRQRPDNAGSPALEVRRNLMRETDFAFKAARRENKQWQSPLELYTRKKQGRSFISEAELKRPVRRATDPLQSYIDDPREEDPVPALQHYFSASNSKAQQHSKRGKAVERALEGVTARLMQINQAATAEIHRLNSMTEKDALRSSLIAEEGTFRIQAFAPYLGNEDNHQGSNTAQFLKNRQAGPSHALSVAENFPFRPGREKPEKRRKSGGEEIAAVSALSGNERHRSNKRASIKRSQASSLHPGSLKSKRPRPVPMPMQISAVVENEKPRTPKPPRMMIGEDPTATLESMMQTVERGNNLPDEYFQQPSRQLSSNDSSLRGQNNNSPGRGSSTKKMPGAGSAVEGGVVYPGLVGKNILTPRSNLLLLKTLEAEGLQPLSQDIEFKKKLLLESSAGGPGPENFLQTKNLPHKPQPPPPEEQKAPKKPVYIPFSKKRPVKVERKMVLQKPKEPVFHTAATPSFYKKTKRYFLSRRKRMLGRPLVVLMFEGVIGEFQRPPKMAHNLPVTLLMRPGTLSGLKLLTEHFQVVLFFKRKVLRRSKRVGLLRNYFRGKNVAIDAMYASRKPKPTFYDDFSQIFLDFGISRPKERVLFINSLELDYEEVRGRCGEHLIKDESTRPFRFLADHMPFQPAGQTPQQQQSSEGGRQYLNNNFQMPPLINRSRQQPVTLLVPHPRMQHREQAIVFRTIAKAIFTLAFVSVFCEQSVDSEDADRIQAFESLKEECISLTGQTYSIKRFGKFQHRRTLTASSSNQLRKGGAETKRSTKVKLSVDEPRRVQTAVGSLRGGKEEKRALLGEELFRFALKGQEAPAFFETIDWVEGMTQADLKNCLGLKFVTTSLVHEQLKVKFEQKRGIKEYHQFVRFRIQKGGAGPKQLLAKLQQGQGGVDDLMTTHKLGQLIGLETASEVMKQSIGYKVLNYAERASKNYESMSGYYWRFYPPRDNQHLMDLYLQGSEDPCSGVRRPPRPPPQDVNSDYEEIYKEEDVRGTEMDEISNSFAVLLPSVTFPMVAGYEVVELESLCEQHQQGGGSPVGKKRGGCCEFCSLARMDFLDWFNPKRGGGCTASMHVVKAPRRTTDEDVVVSSSKFE